MQSQVNAVAYLLSILQGSSDLQQRDCNQLISEIKMLMRGVYIQESDGYTSDAFYSELAHKTNLLEILGQVLQMLDNSDDIEQG